MTPSNRQLIMITISCVTTYLVIILLHLLGFIGIDGVLVLNLLTALAILGYWTRKQFRIKTHYFELREFMALGIEAVVVSLSIFSLLHRPISAWLSVAAYTFFGLHFSALILSLVFTLTFKMKKLF